MSTATAQVFTLPEREFQQAIAEMLGHKEYGRVLDAVRFVRERDPKNIFLIAIERQVRRLEELIASDDPGTEERTKTEESLSQLIQRAWADATTRGVVLTLPADVGLGAVGAPAAPVPLPAEVPVRPPAAATAVSGKAAVPRVHQKRSGSISMPVIVAVVLTVLVIGMGITYFVHRKNQSPDQVTVVLKQPAVDPPPAVIAENVASPKIDSAPPPAPVPETPKTTVRERSRPQDERPASGSGKGQKERGTARSVPPPERRASSNQPVKSLAGFQPPVTMETAAEAQPAAESAQPFIPVQKEPRVVKLADPEIGDAALKYGKQGEVVARVLIGTDGKAMKVRIVKSTNSFLNKAVAEALLKSEFEPGVMTAGPVQSWLTVPFTFR